MTRLKLHLRTWGTVLEWICFSPIELRDKALSKFSEIHRKTTQIRYIVNSLLDDDGDLVSILNQEFYQYKESNDNCSILSMLTQIRKNIGFKYHVALSY
ncbi:hypothetical protein GLOIN_2v1789936 [Rhizophagus irregularis DAOM 181602=DAOM 197198]|uniref:Uncharacterized protein n=1 Tax=Rhizophagus irregularis (strain DAOM 181602 / DAOM 197198 / MUCL 43194) TaxID=747089 RepID=A0A2P4P068_RHIID|nr:hypothetical protein GLOIN_2v1789936 [Rhizophagus irregularis DAOM 181602=DAOM 197198]POG58772.1 hypothetical protein GLOIN_2v1789936 [Rhizophagus irregularis DAOM 181602=DAOM 197198]|eukprot:XP_025165638.1 hypothetical protein GLOIN_2v1789936 [Rhizophagus irregularis DAOM 181602=DAOM 197198]